MLRHHDHITVAELIPHLIQLWMFGLGSAHSLRAQTFSPRRRQRVGLSVKILVCG